LRNARKGATEVYETPEPKDQGAQPAGYRIRASWPARPRRRASGAPSGYALLSARGEHSLADRLSATKPDKSTCYE